jgi:hypothetical protein
VHSPGELGTLAYYCRCAILDEFSDRGYFVQVLRGETAHAGFAKRALLDLNYTFLSRDQRPPHIDYYLRYRQGAGAGEWPVHSAWQGSGHFTLVPASAITRRQAGPGRATISTGARG